MRARAKKLTFLKIYVIIKVEAKFVAPIKRIKKRNSIFTVSFNSINFCIPNYKILHCLIENNNFINKNYLILIQIILATIDFCTIANVDNQFLSILIYNFCQ